MRRPNELIEKYRVEGPPDSSCGAFRIPFKGKWLAVISSDGDGWDHVSVSIRFRCPTWEEMEWVRSLFFDDAETVMQLSVPRDDHINLHPNCLHLWRPQTDEEIAVVQAEWGREWIYGPRRSPGTIPRPPAYMVGFKPAAKVS